MNEKLEYTRQAFEFAIKKAEIGEWTWEQAFEFVKDAIEAYEQGEGETPSPLTFN